MVIHPIVAGQMWFVQPTNNAIPRAPTQAWVLKTKLRPYNLIYFQRSKLTINLNIYIFSPLFLLRFTGPEYCGILSNKNGPFSGCHDTVPVAEFVSDCLYDVCTNEGRHEVFCEALSSYLVECQEAGVSISQWRQLANCCELHSTFI